ncbi:MAG: hypothetical protein APR54_04715 [Candidatus Cloacimonas sp. SDB]|nr:MAG: hypothetical protein APR54_04715 [Candidatus Cloacimonas sp. SDB]
MNLEFHYYLTGLIAKRAGFSEEEAKIIACACQQVDDNSRICRIQDITTGELYRNYISQTMNILNPRRTLWRIYSIFHFIPGDPEVISAIRKDGEINYLTTTPDNPNANIILHEAFQTDRHQLYRIGIASHSFADTWSHQNFTGEWDNFNNTMGIIPSIGHARFGKKPDWISHCWTDPRLKMPELSNKTRFLEAAEKLFNKYCRYIFDEKRTDNSSNWTYLKRYLSALMGPENKGSNFGARFRLQNYKQEFDWLPPYKADAWFREAAAEYPIEGRRDNKRIRSTGNLYYWKTDKQNTHWYKFQEAVKAHQKFALALFEKKLANKVEVDDKF